MDGLVEDWRRLVKVGFRSFISLGISKIGEQVEVGTLFLKLHYLIIERVLRIK